jgi:tRNA(Ile)-lysidine synthase
MNQAMGLPDDLTGQAHKLLRLFPKEAWNEDVLKSLNIERINLIGIACSGGIDSTFALLQLYSAFPEYHSKFIVLHFNHGLRGKDSDRDELFVSSLAKNLGLPIKVQKTKRKTPKTDEDSLRSERLDFLKDIQKRKNFDFIIQGHHLNDVAETLLWRIPRGVSVDGLISPKAVSKVGEINFLRPFISIPRKSILKAMKECGLPWREDSSNNSSKYLRNRIRKTVLPTWDNAIDRDLLQGISTTKDFLAEDAQALQFYAEKAFTECDYETGLDLNQLLEFPDAIQRRVLSLWLHQQVSKYQLTQKISTKAHQLVAWIQRKSNHSHQLSEHSTIRIRDGFLFIEPTIEACPFSLVKLPYNSKIYLPTGTFLHATYSTLDEELHKGIKEKGIQAEKDAVLDAAFAPKGIFIRTRKDGDRFHPLGAPGHKKVSDWMIDRKWNNSRKESTPIILDEDGKILWIPDFPPAEFAKVSASTTKVIRLTYRNSGT